MIQTRLNSFKKMNLTPDGIRQRLSNIKRIAQGKPAYKYERFNIFADNVKKAGFELGEINEEGNTKIPYFITHTKELHQIDQLQKIIKVTCYHKYLGGGKIQITPK